MQTLGVFCDTPEWLVCHILGGVEYFDIIFSSSERLSVYWSSLLMVWYHFVFSLNFFYNKSCI